MKQYYFESNDKHNKTSFVVFSGALLPYISTST